MTIAILRFDLFDIETFDGLVAFIISHLELDDETAAQVPTFIRMAEYRLNRLVTAPERETSSSLTTEAGNQTVSLPVDFRQLHNARVVSSEGYPLKQVTRDHLHDAYTNSSGKPVAFAISEQGLEFGPTPDGAYGISLVYSAKIPPLSEGNQSNWLLVAHADAYVYSALWQACAWLEDIDAATAFRAELMTIIAEINEASHRYRHGSKLVPNLGNLP